jgi:uncharacterized membrane protein YbhN (UPF0104 family)
MEVKKFLKFFKIFIIFYIVISFAWILIFSGKEFFKIISYVNFFFIFLGFLNWFLFLILDGLRLILISRGLKKQLSLLTSIEFITSGSFLALITPFGSGGLPYQIWLLNKYGFSISQTISLIILRGICIFIPYLTFLPFVINFLKTTISKIFLFYSFFIAVLFLIFVLLKKDYRQALKRIDFKFLILALLISFPIQSLYLSFLYIVLKAFSIKVEFPEAFFKQIIMQLSTYFQITPGGLGISEIISSIIISENLDFKFIGFVVVLWRFFSGYLSGFFGFYFVFRRFYSSNTKTLSS